MWACRGQLNLRPDVLLVGASLLGDIMSKEKISVIVVFLHAHCLPCADKLALLFCIETQVPLKAWP